MMLPVWVLNVSTSLQTTIIFSNPFKVSRNSIRNTRGLVKNDTDKTDILRLSEDVELDAYHSPKKGATPMTNMLAAIGSRESFADSGVNKKNLNNIRNTNFRYNRFYKPTKKVRATNRSTVIKRSKESVKQPLPQNKNIKQSKRYGSVPKNLNNSFPSIKNPPVGQPNSGVFNYAISNNHSKVNKKNMNIYNKNTAGNPAVLGGQYSANTSANNIKLNDRSMSPMLNSQKIPKDYENQAKITSYDNIGMNKGKLHSTALEQKMLIKKFKDTNNSSSGTMNKSTISAQHKYHSLNTLKDHGMNMSNKAMTLQLDHDSVEEMHIIIVAFHHSTNNILNRVEGSQPKKPLSNARLKQHKNCLVVESSDDVFI
jgi:hypothetical protein